MRSAKRRPPKSNRKARRLRINLSNAAFGSVEYRPNDATWLKFEVAIGRPIEKNVRDSLIDIIEGFLGAASYETAPFLDDVIAKAKQIKGGALALRDILSSLDSTNKSVQLVVGQNCKIRGVKPGSDQLRTVQHVLTALINACSQSQHYFATQPGFEEGAGWALMIRRLRALFRENGLPSGASQDSSKPSKFVRFVAVLQTESFPAALRRHETSDVALATQIDRLSKNGTLRSKARKANVPMGH
jgi:hypothetical protein